MAHNEIEFYTPALHLLLLIYTGQSPSWIPIDTSYILIHNFADQHFRQCFMYPFFWDKIWLVALVTVMLNTIAI